MKEGRERAMESSCIQREVESKREKKSDLTIREIGSLRVDVEANTEKGVI